MKYLLSMAFSKSVFFEEENGRLVLIPGCFVGVQKQISLIWDSLEQIDSDAEIDAVIDAFRGAISVERTHRKVGAHDTFGRVPGDKKPRTVSLGPVVPSFHIDEVCNSLREDLLAAAQS